VSSIIRDRGEEDHLRIPEGMLQGRLCVNGIGTGVPMPEGAMRSKGESEKPEKMKENVQNLVIYEKEGGRVRAGRKAEPCCIQRERPA
jgi:hypothetical protein